MDDLLIHLLGRTDALFQPARDWSKNSVVVAQIEAQAAYRTMGLPIPGSGAGGDDPAARKAHERWLTALERAGDVIVSRRRRQRTHWRLADAIDWRLRRLTGNYGFWMTVAAMQSIRAHVRLGAVLQDSMAVDAVAEFQLVGSEPRAKPYDEMGRRCALLEEMLAPGFARGWVASASDMNGTNAYALTSEGERVLADPHAFAPEGIDDVAYSRDAEKTYWHGHDDQVAELRRTGASKRGAVAIGIGAGDWDWYPDARLKPFTLFTRSGKQRSIDAIDRAYQKLLRSRTTKLAKGIGDGLD
jgi:hypothetical protein